MDDQPTPEPDFGPVPDWQDDWCDDGDDGWDGLPAHPPEDDFDADAELTRWVADIESGRDPIPAPEEVEGPAGESFAQDGPGDALAPGPVLSALAEQAVTELDGLTDDQVLGLVSAARRLRNRAEFLELTTVAEFTRRREAQLNAAKAAGAKPGRRTGEFADSELAMELVITRNAAGDRMDLAAALDARLPCTLAQLGAGRIDADRAYAIWVYTRWLSAEDAARADEILAQAAPDLRYDQLARRAAALEMRLDPEAARQRKEVARREGRRVEVRREASGNAALSGRELDIADVLAAKANVDALAARLRDLGAAGTLRELRAAVYLSLLQSRDPFAGSAPEAETPDSTAAAADADPVSEGDTAPGAGDGGYAYDGVAGGGRWYPAGPDRSSASDDDDGPQYLYLGDDTGDDTGAGPGGAEQSAEPGEARPGSPGAPLPALINLIVPIGSLLGSSSAPGGVGSWGLTDPADTQALVAVASRHLRTRWCATVVGPDGTAIAHACARGQHPWTPAPNSSARPPGDPPVAEFLQRLNLTLEPIARGTCDHRHHEDQYQPSRKLKHLLRARTATCSAPGCNGQAIHSDIDHIIPHPQGPTDECNCHPACRRHHRCKHAPGWRVEMPAPGVMRWTTPAGRTYTSSPTRYDA